MTDRELMQQALDALEYAANETQPEDLYGCNCLICKTIEALRDRLVQKEPGPVAWSYWQSCLNDDGTQTAPWVHRLSKFKPSESIINKEVVPLYTTPPQRPWVGLTDEEVIGIGNASGLKAKLTLEGIIIYPDGIKNFARVIETKLKEKNA